MEYFRICQSQNFYHPGKFCQFFNILALIFFWTAHSFRQIDRSVVYPVYSLWECFSSALCTTVLFFCSSSSFIFFLSFLDFFFYDNIFLQQYSIFFKTMHLKFTARSHLLFIYERHIQHSFLQMLSSFTITLCSLELLLLHPNQFVFKTSFCTYLLCCTFKRRQ